MITLYEYLSGNIQLPQNVKDYIYTKLGDEEISNSSIWGITSNGGP